MPIKIAHFTLSMAPGGIEMLIANLAAALDRERYDLTVCCLDSGGTLLEKIHQLGYKSIIFQRSPGLDWRLIIRLAKWLHKKKLHIVHTHNQAAHFYAGLAAWLVRVPCLVTTEHSRHYIEKRFRRRLEKAMLYQITDQWITVSETLKKRSLEIDGISSKKLNVISNGIDPNAF